jgi:hypothetical protein
VPILDLDDDTGLAWTQVLSVMHFPGPDDGEVRREFSLAYHVMQLAELERFGEDESADGCEAEQADELSKTRLTKFFRDGGFRALWESEAPAKVIDAAYQRELAGQTAGQLLLHMLACADNPRQRRHARVRRAIYLLEKARRDHPQTFNGRRVPFSRRWLKRAWSEFGPAAHLWAASRIEMGLSGSAAGEGAPLDRFLAFAELLANEATRLEIEWAADAEKAWRVPPGTPLPRVTYELPSINDPRVRRILRSYKPTR